MNNDDQENLIDCAKTIKYIKENFKSLNLTPNDLNELRSTLLLLKVHVKELMVQEALKGDSNLKKQLQDTKALLESQLQHATEQLNPAIEPGIPKSIQIPYNAQKYTDLQDEVEIISDILSSLDTNIQGIISNGVFKEEFKFKDQISSEREEFNKLIDICEKSMFYALKGENQNLFTLSKDSGHFIPNPETISKFNAVVRNPKLVEELDGFSKFVKDSSVAKRHAEECKRALISDNANLALVSDEEYNKLVCQYILELNEIVRKHTSVTEELQKNTSLQIKKTSPFVSFLNKISGKTKRIQLNINELKGQQSEDVEQFKTLFNKGYTHNIENSSNINVRKLIDLFNIYYSYGQSLYLDHTVSDSQLQRNVISILAGDMKGQRTETEPVEAIQKHLIENIQTKISVKEKNKKYAEAHLEECNQRKATAKQSMSPEAQEVIDTNLINENVLYKLPNFLEFEPKGNNHRSFNISPLTSSLILETLMDIENLKTVEDVEKYGISITDEEVNKSSDHISNEIFTHLNRLARQFRVRADNGER